MPPASSGTLLLRAAAAARSLRARQQPGLLPAACASSLGGAGWDGATAAATPTATSAAQLTARRAFLSGLAKATSKVHTERRLIGYSPARMYEVVARVEDYHKFVPWCQRSTVTRRRGDGTYLEAELEVGFQVFCERYVSKVTLQPPSVVHSAVSDSALFDHLDSTWRLAPGPCPNSTWVSFRIDFAFNSPLYAHVADVFFTEVAGRMMGAFVARCEALYGPPAGANNRRRSSSSRSTATRAVEAAASEGTAALEEAAEAEEADDEAEGAGDAMPPLVRTPLTGTAAAIAREEVIAMPPRGADRGGDTPGGGAAAPGERAATAAAAPRRRVDDA